MAGEMKWLAAGKAILRNGRIWNYFICGAVGFAGWLQDAKVRLESKQLQVFVLTEWETGDATNWGGTAEEEPGLENWNSHPVLDTLRVSIHVETGLGGG